MFKPFSYPTDTEIEMLFSNLPEKTAEQLRKLFQAKTQNYKVIYKMHCYFLTGVSVINILLRVF